MRPSHLLSSVSFVVFALTALIISILNGKIDGMHFPNLQLRKHGEELIQGVSIPFTLSQHIFLTNLIRWDT